MRFSAGALAIAVLSTASTASAFAPQHLRLHNDQKAAFVVDTTHDARKESTHFSSRDRSAAGWARRGLPLFSTTEQEGVASSSTSMEYGDSNVGPIIEGPGSKGSPTTSTFGRTSADARSSVQKYLSQYRDNTGAHVVYSKLQENGVHVVNGYSGGAVLPLLDQFHEEHPRHEETGLKPIRWITNSNEQNAGHVTEGIAKALPLGGEHLPVGVCIGTSGPGVTNLITPLQDAICDGVPMIVICGQAATSAPPDAFQSAPAVEMTTPCTKWSYQIRSAAEIPLVMDYAFFVARNGRPGPVFIDLPKDLQNQVLTDDLVESFLSQSLTETSNNEFARLASRKRPNGDKFYSMHLGPADKGLPFEIQQQADGKMKVDHVGAADDADIYEKDHTPMNKVYKFGLENEIGVAQELNDAVPELASIVRRAKKPIILAGQGCNECPEQLKELAERLQIPVTTTLHALGTFDERSDLSLNMMGMHGHPTPNFMVQESDLIVCIGSRFDDRITGRMSDFIPEARKAAEEGRGGVIHVDIRVTEKSKQVKPTFFVHSTAKQFIEQLNAQLDKDIGAENKSARSNTEEWLQRMRSLKKDFPIGIPKFPTQQVTIVNEDGEEETVPRTPMSAQTVVQELNMQLIDAGKIDDAIFTTGVGIHQMVTAQLITWTQPRQMLSSGSLGTMGVSTGYAIGAKLAQWGKIVISIDGDGSFNMTFTELKTIAEQKIPVRILILDNESQMMVEYWQRLFHEKRYLAVRNSQNPDYSKLAGAFGIKAIHCDCVEDLPSKMAEFVNADPNEPILFHVRVERTPCLPLVAPGQRLENMILEDEDFEVDPAAAPS